MYRNMMKTVEEAVGTVNIRFDMSSVEMISLIGMCETEPFDAIRIAFTYGYILGQRALKRENKRT